MGSLEWVVTVLLLTGILGAAAWVLLAQLTVVGWLRRRRQLDRYLATDAGFEQPATAPGEAADAATPVGFEGLVQEALDTLPDDLREQMSNVEIVIEDEPPDGAPWLGLYRGVPLTSRTSGYAWIAPDKITIYRGPLERRCAGNPELLKSEVTRTVLHEVAHHFGISDERLVEIDRY